MTPIDFIVKIRFGDGADGALSGAIIRRLVGLLEPTHIHTYTHTLRGRGGGLISRPVGGAVRQLLAFQKKLAPGWTVNNELILSQSETQHICFGTSSLIQGPH